MKQTPLKIIALVLIVVVVGSLGGCTREKQTPTPVPSSTAAVAPLTPAPTVTAILMGSATPVTGAGAGTPSAPGTPSPVPPTLPTLVVTSTPISAAPTTAPPPSQGTVHVVQAGDTLSSIATRYGTTVAAIVQANNLASDTIYVGQKLVIPTAGGATPPPGTAPGTVHIVQAGETLFSIALRYGVTVEALKSANGLGSDIIYVGQRLVVPTDGQPSGPSEERYHIVQAGDTLLTIAVTYGVTVDAIVQANGLPNANFIWVGQRLRIP